MNYDEKIAKYRYISKQIRDLGVKRGTLGYYFLVSIESILLRNPNGINAFYKEIYPTVAEMYDRKEWTVERNIRHLIDKLWEDGKRNKAYNLFKGEKPTCCRFIYLVKNFLMAQIA